jgi:Rieske Fe-S protein
MNRREFFKAFSWLLLIPIAVLSYLGLKKDKKLNKNKEVFVPKDLIGKETSYRGILLSKFENEIIFLSNKCTHLGCTIFHKENGNFLCSCHGSQFDNLGKAISGPATKPLKKLNHTFIPEKNGYLVFEKT